MGSSFVIGAACLAALALSTSFAPALFVVSRPPAVLSHARRALSRLAAQAAGFGLAQGVMQGATTVLSAEVLPSVADSARDMNMCARPRTREGALRPLLTTRRLCRRLITGPVIAQIAVTYAGGAVTAWLSALWPGEPRLAWGWVWAAMAACFVLALPMLLLVPRAKR